MLSLIVLSLAADSCKIETCAAIEGTCDADYTSGTTPTKTTCPIGSICMDKKCKPVGSTVGTSCSKDSECQDPFSAPSNVMCIDKKCTTIGFPGDSCSKDAGCFGKATCKDSVCVGIKKGDQCTGFSEMYVPSDCEFGAVCSGVCMPLGVKGDKCSTDVPCFMGFSCLNEKCIVQYSQEEGDKCDQASDCASNSCVDGKCKESACPSDKKECKVDSDCKAISEAGSAVCECDTSTGKMQCEYVDCLTDESMMEMVKCVVENKCFSPPGYLDPDVACVADHCSSEKSDVCDSLSDTFSESCFYDGDLSGCPRGMPGWQIALIVVAGVACLGGGFFFYRRRTRNSQYSTV